MKIIIFLILIFLTLLNNLNALTSVNKSKDALTNSGMTTGNWYPIFFDNYNQLKIDSIVRTIQVSKLKRIVLIYDQNNMLANQIIKGINSKVNFVIEEKHDVLEDSNTTKYNHNRVIVDIFRR